MMKTKLLSLTLMLTFAGAAFAQTTDTLPKKDTVPKTDTTAQIFHERSTTAFNFNAASEVYLSALNVADTIPTDTLPKDTVPTMDTTGANGSLTAFNYVAIVRDTIPTDTLPTDTLPTDTSRANSSLTAFNYSAVARDTIPPDTTLPKTDTTGAQINLTAFNYSVLSRDTIPADTIPKKDTTLALNQRTNVRLLNSGAEVAEKSHRTWAIISAFNAKYEEATVPSKKRPEEFHA